MATVYLIKSKSMRQRGLVVSESDSQSGGPGLESCEDHYFDLFVGSPEFNSSSTLVNSALICLRPVGILNNVIQPLQKALSKEKQTSHKPRPQGSMGSFKSVFIAAVEDNVD